MKITIDKSSFLRSLDRAKAVTDSKGPMPILSHVRLVADPDKLHGCLIVSATDLFVAVTTDVACSVDESGDICLNAKDLYDRLRLMPDGDVKITVKELKATIKASGSPRKFILSGLPVSEYPSIPELTCSVEAITANSKALAGKIESTIFSVSTDETRPFLNSLLFQIREKGLTLVSTDGHRLTVLKEGETSSGSRDILVPLRAAKEILNLCKGPEQDVLLYADTAILFVSVNGFVFSCKLADGQFPPYNQIIPSKWNEEIRVPRLALINALKAVSVSTGETGGVKITFVDKKTLINAESIQGTGDDELESDYAKSEPISYGVNANYLIQALTHVCSEFAVLKVGNDLDPILIEQNVDKESIQKEEYIAIVMPMRIS
jgi:DNA polymerase III subunit beta